MKQKKFDKIYYAGVLCGFWLGGMLVIAVKEFEEDFIYGQAGMLHAITEHWLPWYYDLITWGILVIVILAVFARRSALSTQVGVEKDGTNGPA